MPNSFEHVDVDLNIGWDSKEENVWSEDKGYLPCWSYTNCMMTLWKSVVCSKTVDPKMKIRVKQISIIMASLETYESHSKSD